MVLNAIYEADFLGFSYGFRPKRSQHDALDARRRATGPGDDVWAPRTMRFCGGPPRSVDLSGML
jgi:hypothetical protein